MFSVTDSLSSELRSMMDAFMLQTDACAICMYNIFHFNTQCIDDILLAHEYDTLLVIVIESLHLISFDTMNCNM